MEIRIDVAALDSDIYIIRNDAAPVRLNCNRRHYYNTYHMNEGHWCQTYVAFAENKMFTRGGTIDSVLQKMNRPDSSAMLQVFKLWPEPAVANGLIK